MILSSFLVASALAADPTTPEAGVQNGFMSFVPLILIFVIFYFLLIRPQQKKMKEHQEMVNALKNGDKVYTTGGIFGTVRSSDSKDNSVELEIAKDVVIKVLRSSVGEVIDENKKDKKELNKKSKK